MNIIPYLKTIQNQFAEKQLLIGTYKVKIRNLEAKIQELENEISTYKTNKLEVLDNTTDTNQP